MRTLVKTATAVTVTAVVGGLATDPDSRWYARLRKPAWQPPGSAFPLVWTPLYGLIAYAGARALDRDPRGFGRALAVNLMLNGLWTPLFFAARRPRLALADVAALNLSNLSLVRRAWRVDRRAGALLVPYAGWTLFAAALNTAIVRRNPDA
ncbi:TspO/MBR family protein [Actinoallomurus sp. NPDC052274]|uniref:TspO/MBR family protein n=1 Tax=Actinoallomurus sp. NPDC052274 TaxID=3155420 RepID=UPI0034294DA9